MKSFMIVFLFLVSFLSAQAAEINCACVEDVAQHSLSDDHHSDQGTKSESKNDHCQHTCAQCHFAALVPLKLSFVSPRVAVDLVPVSSSQLPIDVSFSFYRPPIS